MQVNSSTNLRQQNRRMVALLDGDLRTILSVSLREKVVVDSFAGQSHGCVWSVQTMQVETKFLRLCQPIALGEEIDGWQVCWLGGWGKNRLFYYVMVARVKS